MQYVWKEAMIQKIRFKRIHKNSDGSWVNRVEKLFIQAVEHKSKAVIQ